LSHSGTPFLVLLGLFGCGEAQPPTPLETSVAPLINGSVAANLYTGVAARGGWCSSVLVAPRVMLTSAHCVQSHALNCTTVAQTPFAVTFAETSGGWADQASYAARTRWVRDLAWRPELFDLSQCPASATYNCATQQRTNIDHSSELVVLYLEDDAPADVTPLPILIAHDLDTSESAAEIGIFTDLEDWVASAEPVVTTVGYGAGSHPYDVSGNQRLGRDYGLQRWIATQSEFDPLNGTEDCDTLAEPASRPAVVVAPGDLSWAQTGDPSGALPGTQYPGFQHSTSGTGDSGGPVLVGAGAAAKGEQPTPLPNPTGGDSYDPNKNYVVGTASLWVGGYVLGTRFTPTWSQGAANFLLDALRDSDGDGFADPVDDDSDNDGCDDDDDQHPDQGKISVGTLLHINCPHHTSPWYVNEGVDSDGDGLKNCEDPNDDNDAYADDDDDCPVHSGLICAKVAETCPWNPIFFDCVQAGCNETLRFTHVVNPDPTRSYSFPILRAAERAVVVSPAPGLSVEQSAAILAGQAAGARRSSSELFLLEVVGPDRRVRGSVAAYDSRGVRIGNLRSANALELRFDASGQAIEILGARVEAQR
jgi:hypothetical protein